MAIPAPPTWAYSYTSTRTFTKRLRTATNSWLFLFASSLPFLRSLNHSHCNYDILSPPVVAAFASTFSPSSKFTVSRINKRLIIKSSLFSELFASSSESGSPSRSLSVKDDNNNTNDISDMNKYSFYTQSKYLSNKQISNESDSWYNDNNISAILSNTTTIVRGHSYGLSNNSAILTPTDAASKVGVRPTMQASKQRWRRAWKLHRFMMGVLHFWDDCRPVDSKLSLACLWWKAISGNDSTSPVYDFQLSYDLLPPVTRWIVHRRICRWYPRLHHANVEIRTAFLDKSLCNVISAICAKYDDDVSKKETKATEEFTLSQRKKIRLIVMGGGYDTRSLKLIEHSLFFDKATSHHNLGKYQQKKHPQKNNFWKRIFYGNLEFHDETPFNPQSPFLHLPTEKYDMECYELDLPEVVHAKTKLLHTRLLSRRPWLKQRVHDTSQKTHSSVSHYPILVPVNLNNLNETRKTLEHILHSNNSSECDDADSATVDNIFLFEGVMIYLDPGIPHSLLKLCSEVLNCGSKNSAVKGGGYLCFADRLENIPGGDEEYAKIEMENTGWKLECWLTKSGLARHMGVASLRGSSSRFNDLNGMFL